MAMTQGWLFPAVDKWRQQGLTHAVNRALGMENRGAAPMHLLEAGRHELVLVGGHQRVVQEGNTLRGPEACTVGR